MAFTYVYGDYKLERTINVNYRPWYAYEISSNATSYSVTIYAGAQISGNTGPVVQAGFTLTLSGTGQETRSITRAFSTHDADGSKRHTFLESKTWTWSKGKTSSTKTITATLSKSNYTTSSVTRTFTVPALASYTVKYNLNGGQGTFPNQTKYYNIALQVWPGANARPAPPTGHHFYKWRSTGGYYYDPGDYYTGNTGTTMTAIYNPNSFTVQYSNNGGSGGANSQTKTYGSTLTLRNGNNMSKGSNYRLKEWNTAANGSGDRYDLEGTMPAGQYPTRQNTLTLYAQWEVVDTYRPATIKNITVWRTNSSGQADPDGTYAKIKFTYSLPRKSNLTHNAQLTVKWSDETYVNTTVTQSSTVTYSLSRQGGFSKDSAFTFTITLKDTSESGHSDITQTIKMASAKYPIDLLVSPTGDVSMGIMTAAVPGKSLQVGEIGTIVSGTRTSTAGSVGTSYTTVATISLPAGVWLITAYNSFNGGTAGRRSILITATSDATYDAAEGNSSTYASTNHCCLKSSLIVAPTTTTTYYLRAKSGTTVDSPEGNLKAVRIM